MFIRKIKWLIGGLIVISSLGVYLTVQKLQESLETRSAPSLPQETKGQDFVNAYPQSINVGQDLVKAAAQPIIAVRRHGKITIPGHINTTQYQSNVQRLLHLQSQCNVTSEMAWQTLIDGWPKPTYFLSEETNIKYCPLGQTKLPYWTFVFRMLYEKASNDKQNKKFSVTKVEFGQRKAAKAKSVFMVRNPFSRLLATYVDKSLLGMDVCRGVTLQTFMDHVMAGLRIKMNLGVALMPIFAMCRPCNYNTFAIITYEDFENDLEYALTAVGERKLKNTIMKNQQALIQHDESIQTLTTIAVKNYKAKACSDMDMLGRHLAEAFHLKGYISNVDRHVFDFEALGMDIEEIEGSVQKMIDQGLLHEMADVAARNQAQTEAFSHVTNATLAQIVATYQFEFDAFGYTKTP